MAGPPAHTPEAHETRVALLAALRTAGYVFVTPTPASCRAVLRRPSMRRAATLRDVFGWSLPFDGALLPRPLHSLLAAADALEETPGGLRSRLRVSSLDADLFLHSAFPAEDADAVFFGPDTYRFAAFLREALRGRPRAGRAVDVGTGAGAGAVALARAAAADRLVLTDVNPLALDLARANCEAAGVRVELVQGDGLAGVGGAFDLVVADPPYIAGATGQAYSGGGDMHGAALSLEWAAEGARRLAPGGRLVLYTGSAIVAGEDRLKAALTGMAGELGCRLAYRELDPDVFGEELASEAYAEVDRIAAVGAVIDRPA